MKRLDSMSYRIAGVPMPGVSYGVCKNVRNCGNWSVDLGDGYCVECWDGGINRKGNKERKKYGYGKRKKRGIYAETET